jgi:hypothetical protein
MAVAAVAAYDGSMARSGRKGFVLITAAAAMVGLLILVGLGTDVGRLYVARGELQVYTDEAAIAAAFELDGTAAGVTRARDLAATGPGNAASPNRWNFGTSAVSGVTTEFASAPSGPFDSNPSSAAGLRFVRVSASANINLYFLPLVPGIGGTQTAAASSVAGQNRQTSLGDGLAPFSPAAHDAGDANFGFSKGMLYTLRWAPGGQRDKPGGSCSGDVGWSPGGSDERGYVDVGQGAGSSSLRAAVVNNSFFLPAPFRVGTPLTMYSGQDSVTSSMQTRFDQDTDVTAPTFATYAGNGRRLLTVAVNDGAESPKVTGFGLFFLQPVPCGTKNTTPCCAEYVGAAVQGSTHQGAGGPGLYSVQLIQ